MSNEVVVLLGTKKGTFLLRSADRADWSLSGPYCETWPMNHVIADAGAGTIWGGGGNEWFGPAVWRSKDLGRTWTHSSAGLAYAAGEAPITAVWSLAKGHGKLYAGVAPAGLFASEDDGETWAPVEGLQRHPTRPEWQAGGAGLILHSIVLHPEDPKQIWVGMSAVGVFHTADGGETWEPRNTGVRCDFNPDDQKYPEFGQCVHCVVMAAGKPNRLYQQNHCGMYRSDDAGKTWASIENGLPSSFGFPAAAHPRDPDTLYLVPLNGDIAGRYMPDARAAVWSTRDGGTAWRDARAGLPQENAFINVLRQAMATDTLDAAGVYFGTGSGEVYASRDEGETWACIARHLPSVSSVETLVVRS